jgi:hypothetical protein
VAISSVSRRDPRRPPLGVAVRREEDRFLDAVRVIKSTERAVWTAEIVERLDEQKLDLLRRWGDGLVADPREEVRAAGRAMVLLIEEIEWCHVDLWNERTRQGAAARVDGEEDVDSDLPASLRAQLAQLRRRHGIGVSRVGLRRVDDRPVGRATVDRT